MNLLALDERHPVALTFVGTASGAMSWLFANSAEITQVAGMIGACTTAAIGLIALGTKLATLCSRASRWVRERQAERRFLEAIKDYSDDDLPL